MNVLDLFSGIGGFGLGLEQAGMRVVAHCEFENSAQRVLKKHWPDVPLFHDVTKLGHEDLKNMDIDLICGGFPCQDISIAGKNAGIEDGERSGLWREFHRLIDEVRPKYAVIENVSALLSRGLNIVLRDLAEIGYDATWTTLDTQYFGLPQRRRRVYILAVRDGIRTNADPFQFAKRDTANCRRQVADIDKSRQWDFTTTKGIGYPFAYFTRQRSDEFAACGVASTITKRDYKSYTDLVVHEGKIRRVTPTERLLVQGFAPDWFDGLGLTDTEKFMLNGMSIPVVKWLGEQIIAYDAGSCDTINPDLQISKFFKDGHS